MKRVLAFIFLMFICVFTVSADEYEEDKFTVTNLDVRVTIAGYKNYFIEEKYNTLLIFGDLPSTRHFIKNIPLTGTLYYDNKASYTAKVNNFSVDTDTYYLIGGIPNKSFEFKIGDEYSLFKELEEFSIIYDVTYDGKELKPEKGFSYTIVESNYDVNNINFDVIFPEGIKREDVSFSLDGKTFSDKIVGLSYDVSNTYSLIGTYNKILKPNQKLIVRAQDVYKINVDSDDTVKTLIVFTSVGVAVISIISIIIVLSKRKKQKA